MASPVITSMVESPELVIPELVIPEVVNPPIPGEKHRHYGNVHLKQVKLPTNNNSLLGTTTSFPRYSEDGSIEGDPDIHEAAAAGNFTRVKELLTPRTSSAFVLANEPNPSTGLTPLHYAASRGHYDIVKWLIDAGAIVDLGDQTGETALLKASYNGHSSVVAFLLQKEANVSLKDDDGWTALHNASAQGYLTIVRYFIEHTNAEIDVKSIKGYTPLMNAASKGKIEIVEYLLNNFANPFIRNKHDETAYDVAATSHEIYICELLEKSERDWWKGKKQLPEPTSFKELAELPDFDQPYDIFNCHITVPIILHENQRSASTFGMALRGSSKYSANNLLRSDVRGSWSYPDGKPCSRDDVKLPSGSISSGASIISSVTSSKLRPWSWVTDWQIDMTHPQVDSQGWQYAKSFDDSSKNWYPAPLSNNGSWVRRRRWVRIMKRTVEIEDGNVLQFVPENNNGADYIERAETIIKKVKSVSEADQLAQYMEAMEILKSGIKTDNNPAHKQEATSLMNTFLAHAEHLDNRIRGIEAPVSPSFKDVPITPTISKASSPTPFRSETSPVNRPRSATPTLTNLNGPSTTSLKSNDETFDSPWNHTVQSEDVGNTSIFGESSGVSPARAHPQQGLTFTNVQANDLTSYSKAKWENDEDVHECRRCHKRFGLWNRRHHCRRCGQVVCDKCSTARVNLPPEQVLGPPGEVTQSSHHRVCDQCFKLLKSRPRSNSLTNSFTSATIVSSSSSTNHRRRTSNNSTLTECPVCNTSLPGGKSAKEHINKCFEERGGNSVSGYKYVVYKLPQNNPLVGQECPICFEEFLIGETVTRLNCFCSYHYHCIRDWFAKGGECPIHYL